MSDFIYRRTGEPVAFRRGEYIYQLKDGRPIGQMHGTHVFTLSGHYIGELEHGVVVWKNLYHPDAAHAGNPGRQRPPIAPLRGIQESIPFEDVFPQLLSAE